MTVELKGIGKITAGKDTLNMLSLYLNLAANRDLKLERYRRDCDEAAIVIFDAYLHVLHDVMRRWKDKEDY